ncbi:MAG: tetratricopeptide repeat protein, partial [Alphaproteobacteria bacterium]
MSRKERRLEKKLGVKLPHAPRQPPAAAPAAAAATAPLALLQQQAMAHYRAGRLAAALEVCRGVIAGGGAGPDMLGFAGMIAVELGALAEGIALYRQALAARPGAAELHYNLANALDKAGKLPAAAAAYRAALALRPDLVPALHNLASALQRLGETEEAVAWYRRALAERATAESERSLGTALQHLGRTAEAAAAFRRAIALRPDWPLAHNNLVYVLFERGEMAAALAACDDWLAASPGNIEATGLKAMALNEEGEVVQARAIYDF